MKDGLALLIWLLMAVLVQASESWATVADNPKMSQVRAPVRVLQLVMNGTDMKTARLLIDKAASQGFNAVLVLLAENVALEQSPWEVHEGAWSRDQLIEWVEYARKKGLEVIPEVRLLTHQNRFFKNKHPDLMFNKSTYDPRKQGTYQRVFVLLDEIIRIIDPKAIHIGHDEVAGHSKHSTKKWLRPGEQMLPADLFLKDVLQIHDYLRARGIETWMWGDMLISRDEFPGMAAGPLHGSASGYGRVLRGKIPHDIVICDWHYGDEQRDFPSLAKLVQEGFRVIGVTWKKKETILNFSRYAAQNGACGMMATTWFYVRRGDWKTVESIIEISGQVFRKDFPDAK